MARASASPPRPWADLAWPLLGAALTAGCFLLPPALAGAGDYGDACTRNTARLTLLLYAAAAALMLLLRPGEWPATAGRGRAARWLWTLGWAVYVVHVLTAFHFAHHWSHARAVEHVREVSGWGEGVYVSYLFTLVWTLDVLWWWARPAAYAARPAWVGWALHAFMGFVVFNGTVVFGSGVVRWAGAVLFAGLACLSGRRLLASQRRSGIPPEERDLFAAGRRSPR
jgi:hypothetical protein